MSLSLFSRSFPLSLSFASSSSSSRFALHPASLHRSFSAFSRFNHSIAHPRAQDGVSGSHLSSRRRVFSFLASSSSLGYFSSSLSSLDFPRSSSSLGSTRSLIFARSFSSSSSASPSSLGLELPSPYPISSTLSFRRSPLFALRLGISELLWFVLALVAGHVTFMIVIRVAHDSPSGIAALSPLSSDTRRLVLAGQTATNLLVLAAALLISRRRGLPQMRQAAEQAALRPRSSFFLRFLYLTACTASVVASVPVFSKLFKGKASEDTILSRFIFTMDPIVLLFCSVVAPITEELLFRRFLFARLVVQIGTLPALLLTSLAFGIIHSSSTSDKVIPATIGGFFMTLAYRYTGSLSVPILIHIINNTLATSLLAIASPFLELLDGNSQTMVMSMMLGTSLPGKGGLAAGSPSLAPLDGSAVFRSLDPASRGYLTDREMFYLLSLTPQFCSFVEPVLQAILDGRHSSLDRLDGQRAPMLQLKPKFNLKKSDNGGLQLNGDRELKLTLVTMKNKAQRAEEGAKAWQYLANEYSFADLQPALGQMVRESPKLREFAEKANDSNQFPSHISPLLSAIHSLPERDRDYFMSRWLVRCVEGYLAQLSFRSPLLLEARLRPWNANIEEEAKIINSQVKKLVRQALQEGGIRSANSTESEMLETIQSIEIPESMIRPRYSQSDVVKILSRLSDDAVHYDRFVSNLLVVSSGAKPHPFDFGAIDKTKSRSFVPPEDWSEAFSKKKPAA